MAQSEGWVSLRYEQVLAAVLQWYGAAQALPLVGLAVS